MKYSLNEKVFIFSLSKSISPLVLSGEIDGIFREGGRVKYRISLFDPCFEDYTDENFAVRYEDDVFDTEEDLIKRIHDEFTRY